MKKLVLSSIAAFSLTMTNAQSFVITPDQHRIDTVIAENYEAYDINLTTAVPEAITFKWKLISNTLPSAWSYSLCDQGACYVGIPTTTETMDPITLSEAQQGMQGFLKINLTTGLNYGNGKAVFYVYDASDINRGDTISFDIRWPAPNGVSEVSFENHFTVYPNPAKDNLAIKNGSGSPAAITFINAIGEVVYTETVFANGVKQLDVAELPKGIYFITIADDEKQFIRKIVLN